MNRVSVRSESEVLNSVSQFSFSNTLSNQTYFQCDEDFSFIGQAKCLLTPNSDGNL